MKPDGSHATRLTFSHTWATNYHPNWSPDGQRVVWGSSESRAWDVMVADFIVDASGMHLGPARRVVHDTTWWETHGFSSDGKSVIATNTRAGFLSSDIYAVDVDTGRRQRLTTDLAWDEHAHLSPDGRELAWISGRHRPAAVEALNVGTVSPLYDFFWIVPGILFEFEPPAGYTTELTLQDADGANVERRWAAHRLSPVRRRQRRERDPDPDVRRLQIGAGLTARSRAPRSARRWRAPGRPRACARGGGSRRPGSRDPRSPCSART
jgi:dipeptidyl aminopeptidase/acylaminoacyl peptidase